MKRVFIATAIALTLTTWCPGQTHNQDAAHVLLPSAKLLHCLSIDCSQLWKDDEPDSAKIYPSQISVDFLDNKSCPLGLTAQYDKSVPLRDLETALNEKYGEWADPHNATSAVKLWRVEPEKFAIQLRTIDKREARFVMQEAGTRTVIYKAFEPSRCDSK